MTTLSRIIRHLEQSATRPWAPPGLTDAPKPAATNVEFERGYKEGFEQGHRDGTAVGRGEQEKLQAELVAIIDALHHPLQMLDARLEQELCSLSIAIARQVIRRELNADPDQIAHVIREVRKVLSDSAGRLRIRAHPDDTAIVRRLFTGSDGESRVELEDDPSIARGGCTVATETSFVDATVESRIAQIAVQLLGDERDVEPSAGRERVRS